MAFRSLTPRQREIADLICLDGLSVVAIARQLGSPEATVRAHVRGIAARLANPHGLPAVTLIRGYAPARRLALAAEFRAELQSRPIPATRHAELLDLLTGVE